MANSPYIVFTNFSQEVPGYINYIRIAINTSGAISFDNGYISTEGAGPLTSYFAPAVIKLNDSSYIVWIEPKGGPLGAGPTESGYISIAPIAVKKLGEYDIISCDISRRLVLHEINTNGVILYEQSNFAPAVFEFNNSPYVVWVD